MANTTKTNKPTDRQKYRVRDGLVCRMSSSITYESGKQLELTQAEYEAHKLVLETEDQYQSRQTDKTQTDKTQTDKTQTDKTETTTT